MIQYWGLLFYSKLLLNKGKPLIKAVLFRAKMAGFCVLLEVAISNYNPKFIMVVYLYTHFDVSRVHLHDSPFWRVQIHVILSST